MLKHVAVLYLFQRFVWYLIVVSLSSAASWRMKYESRRSLGSEADRPLARIGVSAAASRISARSSLLPGLAMDDSLSSASLLVGEDDFDLSVERFVFNNRGFKTSFTSTGRVYRQ